ncbi:MAG: sodium:solute symporter family protein, partial [Bacteroidales bacterium]|nr:sodium:solute symporter family protein [Bacteroidales bacterium]
IGLWSNRGKKDNDFLIAGRKISLTGFVSSVVASYVGGAAIVAYTAYVYHFGISAIAVFLGTALGFLFFIPYALKLRRQSGKREFITLSDWFYYKTEKKTGLFSAIILIIVYFGMLLNQFIAGSSILAYLSGWSYETSLLVSSSVILVYLLLGGFKSVVRTDIFQYIVLFVLFIFLGYVLVKEDQYFEQELFNFSTMDPIMTVVFVAFGILIIFQSAEYWQRVYAAKNNRVVRKGLIYSAIMVLITGAAITIVGLAAHLHIPGIEAREAFAEGLKLLLPQKFISAGLVLLFAAIMSSADTIIFVLSSSMAKDFSSFSPGSKSNLHSLKVRTRLFIFLFSMLGFGFAWFFRDLIQVIIFITGIGFTIIPGAIATFHFRPYKHAVFASFVGGIVYILILIFTGNLIAELSIASVIVAAVILLLFQLFKRLTR